MNADDHKDSYDWEFASFVFFFKGETLVLWKAQIPPKITRLTGNAQQIGDLGDSWVLSWLSEGNLWSLLSYDDVAFQTGNVLHSRAKVLLTSTPLRWGPWRQRRWGDEGGIRLLSWFVRIMALSYPILCIVQRSGKDSGKGLS